MRARFAAAAAVTVLLIAANAVAGAREDGALAGGVNASFSDTFERADGAVGNGWTALRGTWAIQSGSVVASGGAERLLAQTADVGPAYIVSTSLTLTPVASGHAWSGPAANILNHGGTQSFYALRVGQSTSEAASLPPQALWQLVRIDHSAGATNAALLADGAVTAAAGTRLGLSIQVTGGSTMVARITGGAAPIARTVALRTIDRLAGGQAGLYSQSAINPLHEFSLQTTADPGQVTFADDFQRANGSVLNGWTQGRGSWTVNGGTVVPSGDTERLMYHGGVTLGDNFTATASLRLPTPAASARSWTGVAVNIVVNGNGTQTFYALRVAQDAAAGNKALWQVVKVTNSGSASLLKGSEVSAAPGSELNLTLTSRNRGTGLEVGITGVGVVPVNDFVSLPLGTALTAGRAGVYNNAGSLAVNDFSVVTSTRAPNPPASALPALNCDVGLPGAYPLPPAADVLDPQVLTVDDTWAGHPVGQAIVTSGNDQYVGYYNAQRQMTIAKRVLPSTTWTRQTLDSTLGWDSHNYVTMALDSDGHLHVSGNMHVVPLVYFRTTRAGDITSLTRVTNMANPSLEQRVTYPRFVRDAAGALLFNYRNGASGDGLTYYNKYNPATKTWSAFLSTPFTDGQGLRNGYDTGFTRGPDGFYHLGVVWRDTGDAGTSSMPSYLRSTDLLRWQDSAGNPVPLPATYETAEPVDRVPIYGGLVNGNLRIGFDAAGKVMMTYSKYDENLSNQIYVARPDGAGNWTHTKLTNFTGQWFISGGGTLNFQLSLLSGGSALPDGKLRFDYQCNGASRVLIVDPATMTAIADVPRPGLPSLITTVRSPFGGMQVNTASSGGPGGTYVLRWESKVSNQDRPRDPSDTPPAQPLQIYLLRPPSS